MQGDGSPRAAISRDFGVNLVWILGDAVVWVSAVLVTIWSRLEFAPSSAAVLDALLLALIAASVHVGAGLLLGPYLVPHLRGSFEEVTSLARAAAIAGAFLVLLATATNDVLFLPRSSPFLSTAMAVTLMLAGRVTVRAYRARHTPCNPDANRVIILGAGESGRSVVRALRQADTPDLVPVGLLDDDRRKRRLVIDGLPVAGDRTMMSQLAVRTGATHLAVAIPSATSELLRDIQDQADAAGLRVKVRRRADEWLRSEDACAVDLRDINLEDLLGRRVIQLDQQGIAEHLAGKVVLVTGAGGSIGSELCRQIQRFHPARLAMLDRDESALHATQLSLTGQALLHDEDLVLADIRDPWTLRHAFHEIRPDVVFHAAALKHLSLLERYPLEAWQTNVAGTHNVLQAAAEVQAGTFVNISTDKAADPTSVLGYSKRLAERLTAEFAQAKRGRYVSVRFGNVLGSRGSVLPTFTEQINHGGPITITDPKVERYFMLIPEAAQLVLQAGAIGCDGEAMILDMGEPVRIVDLASSLMKLSGREVEIIFTGLRPGEKLTEVLSAGEARRPTSHPLITAVDVPPINDALLDRRCASQLEASRLLVEVLAHEVGDRQWAE